MNPQFMHESSKIQDADLYIFMGMDDQPPDDSSSKQFLNYMNQLLKKTQNIPKIMVSC